MDATQWLYVVIGALAYGAVIALLYHFFTTRRK